MMYKRKTKKTSRRKKTKKKATKKKAKSTKGSKTVKAKVKELLKKAREALRKGNKALAQKYVDQINKYLALSARMNTKDIRKDRSREAKPLGYRISKNGRIYYENRTNRGDIKGEDF